LRSGASTRINMAAAMPSAMMPRRIRNTHRSNRNERRFGSAIRWRTLAERKLAELEAQMARLRRMKLLLESSFHCHCLSIEDCARIIGEASPAVRTRSHHGVSLQGPPQHRHVYVENRAKAIGDIAKLRPGEWEIRFLKASSQVDSNGIALKGRSVDEVCPDP